MALKNFYENHARIINSAFNDENIAIVPKFRELALAYADCVETDFKISAHIRDLNYQAKESLSKDELINIMPKIIPFGYNEFCSVNTIKKLADIFGDSHYFVCRESSVCIYVKPNSRVWLDEDSDYLNASLADEVSFEGDRGMFRFWWD